MSGIAQNSAFLHHSKILFINYLVTASYRHKEIADFGSFLHGHYLKAVHYRFDSPHRIDFRYNHLGAQALCPHGNTLAAPAITGYNNILSGYNQVGGTHHAIPYGLARTIPVIKKCLHCALLTRIIGNFKSPALFMASRRIMPVVVSSQPPRILGISSCISV